MTYAKTRGQTAYSILDDMRKTAAWKSADAGKRADWVSDVYGYATAVAKDGTASAYKIADASPKWYAKAQASGDPAKYIMNRK